MNWLFKFLFKYPALVFQQGEFAFAATRATVVWVAVVGLLALAALITYRGITTDGRVRDRMVLVGLRLGVVALLLFCLFRPSIILKAAVPQQNFLGRCGFLAVSCTVGSGLLPIGWECWPPSILF